jgi:hypothetical protein
VTLHACVAIDSSLLSCSDLDVRKSTMM